MAPVGSRHRTKRGRRRAERVPIRRMGSRCCRTDRPAGGSGPLPGARRSDRDPFELLAEWRAKTPADRERYFNYFAPNADDDLLRAAATLADVGWTRSDVAAALSEFGERIVSVIADLAPSSSWPGVLFVARSADDLLSAGSVAVTWANWVPRLSRSQVLRSRRSMETST